MNKEKIKSKIIDIDDAAFDIEAVSQTLDVFAASMLKGIPLGEKVLELPLEKLFESVDTIRESVQVIKSLLCDTTEASQPTEAKANAS